MLLTALRPGWGATDEFRKRLLPTGMKAWTASAFCMSEDGAPQPGRRAVRPREISLSSKELADEKEECVRVVTEGKLPHATFSAPSATIRP